jgi:hypothetical protein
MYMEVDQSTITHANPVIRQISTAGHLAIKDKRPGLFVMPVCLWKRADAKRTPQDATRVTAGGCCSRGQEWRTPPRSQ